MKFPDDYLIPGIEPFHVEEAGIIYCGDCREILPHLPKVDLVLTDPPWNLGYFNDDNKEWADYAIWLEDIRNKCLEKSEVVWIFQSTKAIPYIGRLFEGWRMFGSLKNFCQMTPKSIPNSFDIAFYSSSNGYCGKGRNFHLGKNSNIANTGKGHPTIRPLDTMKYIVNLYNHQLILDPFLGSGTTAVAAKELGRKFIGIEISEEYCKIAVKRLRQGVLDFG